MKHLIILIVITATLASCRPCRQISASSDTVRTVHTDYRDRILLRTDSVLIRDSITVASRGDTVLIDRWHVRDRSRIIRDTVTVIRTDTVLRIRERTLTEVKEATLKERVWNTLLKTFAIIGFSGLIGIGLFCAFEKRKQ